MNKKIIIPLLAILLIFLAIGSPSAQETNDTQINANEISESKTFDDLKTLVENSTDNSIITLNNDYKNNNNTDFNGIEIKGSNITLDGNGHTIDGNSANNTRIFNITGSNIIIKNLIFVNSKHDNGGAIYNTGSNVSIINSTFINNTAIEKGGAIYNKMDMTIFNSKFVNNTSPEGEIFNEGNLNYNIETFDDLQNAINIISGTITLNSNITMTTKEAVKFANGIVINKTIALDCGKYTIDADNLGRIFNITQNATLNINEGNLVNGKSDIGGAIYNSGTLITTGVDLANNTATSYGGAIFNENIATIYLSNLYSNNILNSELNGGSAIYNYYNGTLTLNNSYVYNNRNLNSGAITTIGDTQITYSYFKNNSGWAISTFGNLVSSYQLLSISNSNFIENNGGIYLNGTLFLVSDCEFNKNNKSAISVDTSNKYIMGIINNTRFLNNHGENGGALQISEGEYTILNSSFINNTARVGGAIEFDGEIYERRIISQCIFENNSATISAGAIYNNKRLDIKDSIFINNTSPEGTFTNFGKINLHITTLTQLENIINDFSGVLTLYNDIEKDTTDNITIKKDITIDGNGLTAIDLEGQMINITKNVTITNIELTNGLICNEGNLNITNSIIYNNTIYNNKGSVAANYNWWGSNNPDWEKILKNIDIPNVFAALNLTTSLDSENDCYMTLTLYWNNTDIIASIPPCYGNITINEETIERVFIDGVIEEIYHLNAGTTNISARLHDQILNSTIIASQITPEITIYGNNITYGENLSIIVILPDYARGNVTITINSTSYTQNIRGGKAVLNIGNLSSDNYTVMIKYNGDENYLATTASKNITVYKAKGDLVVNINNTNYGEKIIVNALLNEIEFNGTINITINEKNYIVAIINGSGLLNADNLNAGQYNFTGIWAGNKNYNNTTFNGSFNVNKAITNINITEGENGTVVINLADDAGGSIIFSLNDKNYTANIKNGTGIIILPKLASGNYSAIISYSGDNNYLPQTIASNFTISKNNSTLDINDTTIIYHDGSKFIAKLIDFNKNPIANATILIKVNNITYERITDNEGFVYLNINLNSGTYQIFTEFSGNQFYNPTSSNNTITVKTTILANNLVKMYCNDTQFTANFTDSKGNPLANSNVTFNINGVIYTKTTDNNGTAKLNINLRPGNYIITAYNSLNNEQKAFNISVYSLIESSDLTKYYKNESRFVVKVYDKTGNIAINKTVQFNINGIIYTKITNDEGLASLNINLKAGNYQITTITDNLAIGNNIEVLPTLITKDLTMKYLDNSKFNITTLDNMGNPLSNQSVKFNINGVFYNKITDNDGIASLNINLNKGKYIITSYWRDYEVGNTITING